MKLLQGNNIDLLALMPDNSVDSIVTDPPYGLKFMGKKWDHDVPSVELWRECLRVLKPGGHLLSFGGSRTYHRMAVAIEDAGFEIRDQIMWVYGSGFPKSHNIGKAVDKLQGNPRESLGIDPALARKDGRKGNSLGKQQGQTGEVTKGSSPWEGWGTALKPAHEPIVLARKPLSEGTIAANVLKWGTGGLNIDGCRVEFGDESDSRVGTVDKQTGAMGKAAFGVKTGEDVSISTYKEGGRFPANFIHDGIDVEWSRYFYCAKTSKKERGDGNNHPTVKPTKLMSYLCRLVTPPNGVVLDPFMGSGSTGIAAKQEGFDFIGMELDGDYYRIAKARINNYEA
jgi:site-specific DNA-methyltransferase (adenine-specific)